MLDWRQLRQQLLLPEDRLILKRGWKALAACTLEPAELLLSACVLGRENIYSETDPGKSASVKALQAGPFSTKPNQHSMEIVDWGPQS